MRKLILSMFMSLDGHIEGPNGEFVPPDWSDEMQTHWSDDTINEARKMLDRFYGAVRGLDISADERAAAEPPATFIEALEDDIPTNIDDENGAPQEPVSEPAPPIADVFRKERRSM